MELSVLRDSPTAKVLFEVRDAADTIESESLWAHDLGDNRYMLANIPFYAYDVSLHDTIHAQFDKTRGFLVYERVAEKSGNRTARLVLAESPGADTTGRKFLDRLAADGCSIETAYGTYVAINIPPQLDIAAVQNILLDSPYDWELSDPSDE